MKFKLLILTIILLESAFTFSQSNYCANTDFLPSDYIPNHNSYTFPVVGMKNKERDSIIQNIYRLTIFPDKNRKINDIHLLKNYINITELTIISDVDKIPVEIFRLPNLKQIHLYGIHSWDWDEFFIKLSKVKQLESLIIDKCSFVNNRLPNSICLMKQIYHLEFDNTYLYELPDSFNLSNLCYLKIKCSDIRSLPSNFNGDNLKKLCLAYNGLNGVPKQIGNYKNLFDFDFSGNFFYTSDTLTLINNIELSNLFLNGCGIEVFPIGLRNMKKLIFLDLEDNKFKKSLLLLKEYEDFKNINNVPCKVLF